MSKRASPRCAGSSQFPHGHQSRPIASAARQMQQGVWGAPTASFSAANFDCPTFLWFIERLCSQGGHPRCCYATCHGPRDGVPISAVEASQVDFSLGRSDKPNHKVLCIGEHAIPCWSSRGARARVCPFVRLSARYCHDSPRRDLSEGTPLEARGTFGGSCRRDDLPCRVPIAQRVMPPL